MIPSRTIEDDSGSVSSRQEGHTTCHLATLGRDGSSGENDAGANDSINGAGNGITPPKSVIDLPDGRDRESRPARFDRALPIHDNREAAHAG